MFATEIQAHRIHSIHSKMYKISQTTTLDKCHAFSIYFQFVWSQWFYVHKEKSCAGQCKHSCNILTRKYFILIYYCHVTKITMARHRISQTSFLLLFFFFFWQWLTETHLLKEFTICDMQKKASVVRTRTSHLKVQHTSWGKQNLKEKNDIYISLIKL